MCYVIPKFLTPDQNYQGKLPPTSRFWPRLYILVPYTSDLAALSTFSLSYINTSFLSLDLLTYPIKLDALQGFGEEDLDLGVD
jgi:hypothetical protein